MQVSNSKLSTFTFYLTLFVILWGALVRITHSGAGCGRHWPLCDGQVVPLDPSIEMIIEFTHRLTSGASAIFVLLLFWVIRKQHKQGVLVKLATFALFFMGIEVLIGASLVLFGWVKDNTSFVRAYMMGFHLINSFLLVGSLYLLKEMACRASALRSPTSSEILLLIGFLVVASMGAVTALGDTLFPTTTLQAGLVQDFLKESPLLIQLRVIHPILAVLISFYLIRYAIEVSRDPARKNSAMKVIAFVIGQILLGILTVLLLAPSGLQILHLLLALSLWCGLLKLILVRSS